jgi:hypothetical protein
VGVHLQTSAPQRDELRKEDDGLVVRDVTIYELIVSGTLLGWVVGCLDTDRLSILGASAGPLVQNVRESTKAGGKSNVAEPDSAMDAAPRHVYRASDMLLGPCTRLDEAGAIVGKGCQGGFVVFGPYASISGKSNVQVRFEIESDEELVLSSDVVSNMGKLHHGDLGNQTVRPEVKRRLSYRAQLAEGGEAVEARIFIRPGDDGTFKISNLEIAVR